MQIKSCSDCKFHETKREVDQKMSYCARENCWSEYSKCVAIKALKHFLQIDTLKDE